MVNQDMRDVLRGAIGAIKDRFKSPSEVETALVMTGGGTRAAYQAGVLQYIAEAFPEAQFPILTGVSARAINTAHLANHPGTFAERVGNLVAWWGRGSG